MAKRFGSGEFENTDVGVKQSTLEARYIFLKMLKQRKNHIFVELLSLFNTENLPPTLLTDEEIDNTFRIFLPLLLKKNIGQIKMSPNITETPLIRYYQYLVEKEEDIKRLENDEELQQYTREIDSVGRRRNAIKKIIPDWKELNKKCDAKELCKSLENWAQRYNLNEGWYLNFVLDILLNFKSKFDSNLLKSNGYVNPKYPWSFRSDFLWDSQEAVTRAITSYSFNTATEHFFSDLGNDINLPAFEYQRRSFKLDSQTWSPRMTLRKDFEEEMLEQLEEKKKNLEYLNKYWNYSSDEELNKLLKECKGKLELYCDYVEDQNFKDIEEFTLPIFQPAQKFVWNKSEKDRETFVEETLVSIKAQLKDINNEIKSLEFLTLSDFKNKLKKYCDEVKKLNPPNWEKTPRKNSDEKHFEWLIDYQVSPYESYTKLADKNIVDRKTVSEAVKTLAQIIGIIIRKENISGRPKGSKDSEKANRQIGIYKK